MLIVEVLKTVGELASAITQKTQELERLKQEYESKLRVVNLYIARIEGASQETDSDICSVLETQLRCSKCQNVVYDLNQDTEYILIPKKKAHLLRSAGGSLDTELGDLSLHAQTPNSTSAVYVKPKKSNSKKTCSFCNQTGHSRARCFERLSKEPVQKD